jgi:galactokinase
LVLPMAIDRHTILAAAPVGEPRVRLHSLTFDEVAEIPLAGALTRGRPAWADYVRGVIAGFQATGVTVPGFNAVIGSNVPPGGGLSSSAALEVATATLLEALTGTPLEPGAKARLCQRAEHDFAGVPCGIMDQFAAVFGRAGHCLLLDCRTLTAELVPVQDPNVQVLIINTNVRHELGAGEYAVRRAQCEAGARDLEVASLREATVEQLHAAQDRLDPVVFRRVRHVITEIARTRAAARALRRGDWEALGLLMAASHDSLRDDFSVSCRELDAVVDLARGLGPAQGVIGCRMTGAGFGGCCVALVRAEAAPIVSAEIARGYQEATGLAATLFLTRPAAGAGLLSLPTP